MGKKLNLDNIKLESFVTTKELKGGAEATNLGKITFKDWCIVTQLGCTYSPNCQG